MNKKNVEASKKILAILNSILSKYSEENSISLILSKKNVVIGKTELDITSEILELLNAEIKSVKLN